MSVSVTRIRGHDDPQRQRGNRETTRAASPATALGPRMLKPTVDPPGAAAPEGRGIH
jgi:hypothetical protein